MKVYGLYYRPALLHSQVGGYDLLEAEGLQLGARMHLGRLHWIDVRPQGPLKVLAFDSEGRRQITNFEIHEVSVLSSQESLVGRKFAFRDYRIPRFALVTAEFENPDTEGTMVTYYQTSDYRDEEPEFYTLTRKEFLSNYSREVKK